MEYLMTYGWALLIIVVVGAALFALGILNPSTYTQSRCTGFQYFTFQDQQLTQSTFSIDLLNGPKDIVVTSFKVDATSTAVNPAVTVAAGNRVVVSGNNAAAGSKADGDSYSYGVSVTYNVTGGISNNVDQGTCTGKVQ